MIGITSSSPQILSLMIDRTKFHVGIIDKYRPKRKDDSGYHPSDAMEDFLSVNSGGRTRCILVNGFSTLNLISNVEDAKFVVFDSPQILSKFSIPLFDAKISPEKNGVWDMYKILPEQINSRLEKTESGFSLPPEKEQYNIRIILPKIAKKLKKPKEFEILVAKYIFGLKEKEIWNQKAKILSSLVDEKYYNLLMGWLDTFAPDALGIAFQDLVIYAPHICGESERILKIAKRACKSALADFEDFLFLIEILPPLPEYKDKFLTPLPFYLTQFRKSYPLVKSKGAKELPNFIKNS